MPSEEVCVVVVSGNGGWELENYHVPYCMSPAQMTLRSTVHHAIGSTHMTFPFHVVDCCVSPLSCTCLCALPIHLAPLSPSPSSCVCLPLPSQVYFLTVVWLKCKGSWAWLLTSCMIGAVLVVLTVNLWAGQLLMWK